MKRVRHAGLLLAVVVSGVAMSLSTAQEKPATPAQQYQALTKEFSAASSSFWQETNQQRQAAVDRAEKLPQKFLELAENNPKDPIALDALMQVVSVEYWLNTHTSHPGWGKESPQAKAIAQMLRDHIESEKLGEACRRVHYNFHKEGEMFLRTVLEKSPHREVQGVACLRLAQFLPNRLDRLDLLVAQPELARRYEDLYSKEYLETLRRQDRGKVLREAESLYERAIEKYSDVKLPYDVTVGDQARTELFEIRYLAIGKEAPEIEGVDQEGQPLKLSDYRGKVVLLYFWTEF